MQLSMPSSDSLKRAETYVKGGFPYAIGSLGANAVLAVCDCGAIGNLPGVVSTAAAFCYGGTGALYPPIYAGLRDRVTFMENVGYGALAGTTAQVVALMSGQNLGALSPTGLCLITGALIINAVAADLLLEAFAWPGARLGEFSQYSVSKMASFFKIIPGMQTLSDFCARVPDNISNGISKCFETEEERKIVDELSGKIKEAIPEARVFHYPDFDEKNKKPMLIMVHVPLESKPLDEILAPFGFELKYTLFNPGEEPYSCSYKNSSMHLQVVKTRPL